MFRLQPKEPATVSSFGCVVTERTCHWQLLRMHGNIKSPAGNLQVTVLSILYGITYSRPPYLCLYPVYTAITRQKIIAQAQNLCCFIILSPLWKQFYFMYRYQGQKVGNPMQACLQEDFWTWDPPKTWI